MANSKAVYNLFKCFLFFSTFLSAKVAAAQEVAESKVYKNNWLFGVSAQNNAITLPFSGKLGLFHGTFHPGVVVQAGYLFKEKQKIRLIQQGYFGVVHHRLVHTVLSLHTETEGRFRLVSKLHGSAGLGFGLAQVINTRANQIFKLQDDGTYKQVKRAGQTKGLGSFSLGLSYHIDYKSYEIEPFIKHQFWLLFPFIKSYVPLLPNVALQAGVSIRLKSKS